MLDKKKTQINSMNVKIFRNLEDVDISLGSRITLIAGRNGTSKSTILGILAQICSFEKNYKLNNGQLEEEELKYKTVYEQDFFSEFKSHFRISSKYDTPSNKYIVEFQINDAQEELSIKATLQGTKRRRNLRLVLRKSDTIGTNTSRNITHPSIFLSLERLLPISKRENNVVTKTSLTTEDEAFLKDSHNRIFTTIEDYSNISSNLPENKGVRSTVVTNDKYDVNSASSGEDNIGQILMALISFIKLKRDWPDYKGGLLLIDEIDASLFPRAQIELFNLFDKVAKKYDLQIVFTTHSPTIISHAYECWEKTQKNESTKNNIAINYLSDSRGRIENKVNFTLTDIIADLNITGKTIEQRVKINCYYEDNEAYLMSEALLKSDQKKRISSMKNVKLGCENYLSLISANVPEFKKLSLIVLDGDVDATKAQKSQNVILLPTKLPPDQLLYKFLNELDPSDEYWNNKHGYTKSVFRADKFYRDINEKTEFDFEKNKYVLKSSLTSDKACRELFKNWFNHNNKLYFNKSGIKPFIRWKKSNKELVKQYQDTFDKAYVSVFGKTNYLV
ncbi:AAA family ATPase [Listeria monocytogenes]|nr:AAA family ATPase [Listeria monocytogenes]EKE3287362.1 AAA family ATPase [Listeria monocytogenes]ELJ4628656.1 AAA family ATPase [Listeria monocytogenes]